MQNNIKDVYGLRISAKSIIISSDAVHNRKKLISLGEMLCTQHLLSLPFKVDLSYKNIFDKRRKRKAVVDTTFELIKDINKDNFNKNLSYKQKLHYIGLSYLTYLSFDSNSKHLV